jgi:hypothetical protein
MRPRHAAALVLVGWYLMTPPLGKNNLFDYDASVSRWTIQHVFDSAADCDLVRSRWRERAQRMGKAWSEKKKLAPEDEKITLGQFYDFGDCECIATDDPRLKGK